MGRLKKAVFPVVLLIALYWAVFGGEYTVFEVIRARAERDAEAAEVARLERAIDSLSARVDSLENDPATLERIARERYGMIRDGETLYRFAPADSALDSAAAAAESR